MRSQHAFSLSELAVVLVIIGLVAGGIAAGRSMIRSSEMQHIGEEYQLYAGAMTTFIDKYGALPGDMPNATRYWGYAGNAAPATSCVSRASITAVTVPGTCDGNGDGKLNLASSNGNTSEQFRCWQHLAYAGLIQGKFSGNSGAVSVSDPDLGVNSPQSVFPHIGWGCGYYDNASGGNGYSFADDMTNWFVFGSEADNVWPDGPALTTQDAWDLDSKLDDGKPATGMVRGNVLGNCVNSTSTNDRTATYKLSDVSPEKCGLVFKY